MSFAQEIAQAAKRSATEAGFDLAGIAPVRKEDMPELGAFIEWVDAEYVVEEKPKKEKKAKRKEPETKPQQTTPEAEQPAREEPKVEPPAPRQEEPGAPPAEEPKPKKRRWFGRKSDES